MARRSNKAKGVVKVQKPSIDQNLKAKFELAKTQAVDQCIPSTSHPSSVTPLALNKQIMDNNNTTTNLPQKTLNNRKRRNRKKGSVPNVPELEKDSKDNLSTNRPLNIHQQRVLDKRLNKLECENKANIVKHVSCEGTKNNFNVHQLKVMEKLAMSKNARKTPLASKSGVSAKTSPRSKNTLPVQPSVSKIPESVQTPSGTKTPVSPQTPSGSKNKVPAQKWVPKTPGSVQTPSGSRSPIPAQTWTSKTPGSVQTPSGSRNHVPAQTWAPKTPTSVQTPSGSRSPVPAQTWTPKTPGSVQTPSGSRTPVPAQTWVSKTPVSARTPSGSKTSVSAQAWESKTPISIQKPPGYKIPRAQTLNTKQSKNETQVGGSQINKKTTQNTRKRRSPRKAGNLPQDGGSAFEQVTPKTRRESSVGKGSAEKRLHQLRKRLSESDSETPKVSPQRNLQNDSMAVDDQGCKRRAESDYQNANKRKKVEPLEELLNTNNESVCAKNVFDTSNNAFNISKDVFSTSNKTFDSSNNASDTSKDIFVTKNNNSVPSFMPENTNFNSSNVSDQSKNFEEEEMDWETVAEHIMQVRGGSQNSTSNSSTKMFDNKTIRKSVSNSSKPIFVVVDTNIFILHLSTVEKLTDSTKKGIGCEIRVMVPYIVLCELDKLKLYMHGNFANTQAMARKAMRYLHNNLTSNPKICGQSAKTANEHLLPCHVADDEILNCCLQLTEAGETVVLLTNDINLCNKAAVNKINMLTHKQFIVEFFESLNSSVSSVNSANVYENKLPSAKIERDFRCVNNSRELNQPAEVTQAPAEEKQIIIRNTTAEKFNCVEELLCQFLTVPLEDEMKDKFDNLWTKVVLVEPPWTLSDILKCLVKHWIAVFKDMLPSSVQSVIRDLQVFFPPRKNARRSNTSEANLKVICHLGVKLVEYFKLIRKYTQSGHKCIQDIQNVLTDTYDKSKTNSLDNNTVSTTDKIQENKSKAFWKDNSREDDFWNDNSPKVNNKMRSSIIKPSDVLQNESYTSPKEIIQNIQTNLRRVSSNQIVPKNSLEVSYSTYVLKSNSSSNEIVDILKLILQGLSKFCADLANALEVSHSLNIVCEKAPPLSELVTQATPVGNQLQLIVNCTSRMLSSLSLESLPLQQRQQESILASEALSNILYDTYHGMGHTFVKLDSNDLLAFCTMHRNLLEEAYNDFVILHNLIMECSQKYAAIRT